MKRLLIILMLTSTSTNAKENVNTTFNSLLFNPTPVEAQSTNDFAKPMLKSKQVKPYIIVNGVWMAPVDKN